MLELMRPRSGRALPRLAALAVPLALAGCDHPGATGPTTANDPLAFAQQINLPAAQAILVSGPTRVKLEVIPGTLTARTVVLKQGEQLSKPERIQSPVMGVAVASSGNADT